MSGYFWASERSGAAVYGPICTTRTCRGPLASTRILKVPGPSNGILPVIEACGIFFAGLGFAGNQFQVISVREFGQELAATGAPANFKGPVSGLELRPNLGVGGAIFVKQRHNLRECIG